MPELFENSPHHSTFAEKMEYNIKKDQAVEMCQSFVSVVTGKCIERAAEQGERVEVSVIQPHHADISRRISIRFTKDGDANIIIGPLKKSSSSGSNLWQFIEEYLPDYYHDDDVLRSDILCRYLANEDVDESDLQWIYQEFGSDKTKVQDALERLDMELAHEALLNWLESHEPDSWK
jgi:hypothetical protein